MKRNIGFGLAGVVLGMGLLAAYSLRYTMRKNKRKESAQTPEGIIDAKFFDGPLDGATRASVPDVPYFIVPYIEDAYAQEYSFAYYEGVDGGFYIYRKDMTRAEVEELIRQDGWLDK